MEDNRGDVRLVREALAERGDSLRLSVAHDGHEAERVLRESARPDLILLDMNLPGVDGRGLLSRIKSDPGLRRIPVIVLTSSDAPRDLRSAYDLHANCYLIKPPGLEEFVSLIRSAVAFWTEVVRLPG